MDEETQNRKVFVYADWPKIRKPALVGTLDIANESGLESLTFAYAGTWLPVLFAQILDPELRLRKAVAYVTGRDSHGPGLLLDSAPGSWGRLLMDRREALLAGKEGRQARQLTDMDYLLGVSDHARGGALRFKLHPEEPFCNDRQGAAIPTLAQVSGLAEASLLLEKGSRNPPELLLSAAMSLGGTRPKAGFADEKGAPWIAKFPALDDRRDIGAWEMVAYELAIASGLRMSESRALRCASGQHIFLTKRFDRNPAGRRLHFSSARTLLGYAGSLPGGTDRLSYLALAEFLARNGGSADRDLEELWRRIMFSIYIRNTNDHPGNHGFLLDAFGWHLSPAYDLNPENGGQGLHLNITGDDNTPDPELALRTAGLYRLTAKKANAIHGQVRAAVKTWRQAARKYSIPQEEQELMAGAFLTV
jgi:serine/threonine-protein kinase HipA